jgi:ribosomal protein S12 methylthiotransferase accessory factor YcaO
MACGFGLACESIAWRNSYMIHHRHLELGDLLQSVRPEFNIQELELPDIPVYLAVAIPKDGDTTGRRPRLPSGRGLTAQQAVTSAVGESVELLASLAQACDRESNVFETRAGVLHVLAHELQGQETAFVSAQQVYLDWSHIFDEPLHYDADSNGCAAGLTWGFALKGALLECIERDAVAIWWYGRQCRAHFPSSFLDAIVPRVAWWLATRKRVYRLIDVTTEVGVPVVVAVSHNEDGHEIAMGSAAGIDTRQAAVSAVTEMVQMEVSMNMGYPNEELKNWRSRTSIQNTRQFHPNANEHPRIIFEPNPEAKCAEAGHKMFSVNLTRRNDLLSTARVLVPTFSQLHRTPNADRIIAQSQLHPQFMGVQRIEDLESFAPY